MAKRWLREKDFGLFVGMKPDTWAGSSEKNLKFAL